MNFISIFVHSKEARMAELVDALVSNTNRFPPVPVRSRVRVREEQFERPSLVFVVFGEDCMAMAIKELGLIGQNSTYSGDIFGNFCIHL